MYRLLRSRIKFSKEHKPRNESEIGKRLIRNISRIQQILTFIEKKSDFEIYFSSKLLSRNSAK